MSKIKEHYRKDSYSLIARVSPPEMVNERLCQALGQGEWNKLLPVQLEIRGKKQELTVTADGCIPLKNYFNGILSRKEVLRVFRHLADLVFLCGQGGMKPDHLDLDPNRIFLEPQSLRLFGVYWPIVNFAQAVPPEQQLKKLPALVKLYPSEDRSFLTRYQAFFESGAPFSASHFCSLIQEMEQEIPQETTGHVPQSENTRITYAVYTDTGSRPVNEDSYGSQVNADRQCFVLCDGLGGHGMGDTASQLAVQVCLNLFENTADLSVFPGEALQASQDILLAEQMARNAQQKMKTTGVVLAMDRENAYIGHVGDSRLYIFEKNKVKKRTLDHSIPQMLVMTGDIKESEIRHHPERNMLLRVLGIPWEEPMYECMAPVPLDKCQAFLLCSDGFWEYITEKEMCEFLKTSANVEEWLSRMAGTVKRNGKNENMDNNTAVAVWVGKKEKRHRW